MMILLIWLEKNLIFYMKLSLISYLVLNLKEGSIMKAKDYKSITNILESKNKGKQFFTFMDFEDTEIRKKEVILPLPKQYFNNIIKLIKGDK